MDNIILLLTLLLLGFLFGRIAEKRHYQSIIKREKKYRQVILLSSKQVPEEVTQQQSCLVSGSVVVSVDYFKRFLANLRSLFGGRISSYESLLDRARREAILRLKEQAFLKGSKMVINLKLETSSISKGRKNTVGSVEVLAYATAFYPT
ncbi:MAG: heavy metal-binding domain-containing protein [Gammaproteobacteria bacterium]|nr:heavy metal-binding domain-containing protein [Gammaproteobacteria bacterium]